MISKLPHTQIISFSPLLSLCTYQLVARQSTNSDAPGPAHRIMDRLREHSEKLLDQVLLVSQELIRVAITWAEEWYTALEVNHVATKKPTPTGCIFSLFR